MGEGAGQAVSPLAAAPRGPPGDPAERRADPVALPRPRAEMPGSHTMQNLREALLRSRGVPCWPRRRSLRRASVAAKPEAVVECQVPVMAQPCTSRRPRASPPQSRSPLPAPGDVAGRAERPLTNGSPTSASRGPFKRATAVFDARRRTRRREISRWNHECIANAPLVYSSGRPPPSPKVLAGRGSDGRSLPGGSAPGPFIR